MPNSALQSHAPEPASGFDAFEKRARAARAIQVLDLENLDLLSLQAADDIIISDQSPEDVYRAIDEAVGKTHQEPETQVETAAKLRERIFFIPTELADVELATAHATTDFLSPLAVRHESTDAALAQLNHTLENSFFDPDQEFYANTRQSVYDIIHGPEQNDPQKEAADRQFLVNLLQNMMGWVKKPACTIYRGAQVDLPTFQQKTFLCEHEQAVTIFGVAAAWAQQAHNRFPDDPRLQALARELSFNFNMEGEADIPETIPLRHPIIDAADDYWKTRQLAVFEREGVSKMPSVTELMHDASDNMEYNLEQEMRLHSSDQQYVAACQAILDWMDDTRRHMRQTVGSVDDLNAISLRGNTFDEQQKLFYSLFIIKRQNPQMYVEMLGQVPDDSFNANSAYFGNALQLALANTAYRVEQGGERSENIWLADQLDELQVLAADEVPEDLALSTAQIEHFIAIYQEKLDQEEDQKERLRLHTLLAVTLFPALMTAGKIKAAHEYRKDLSKKMRRLETASPDNFLTTFQTLSVAERADPDVVEILQARLPKQYEVVIAGNYDIDEAKKIEFELLQTTPAEEAARWIISDFADLNVGNLQSVGNRLSNVGAGDAELFAKQKRAVLRSGWRPDITAKQWGEAHAELQIKHGRESRFPRLNLRGKRLEKFNDALLLEDISLELAKYLLEGSYENIEDQVGLLSKARREKHVGVLVAAAQKILAPALETPGSERIIQQYEKEMREHKELGKSKPEGLILVAAARNTNREKVARKRRSGAVRELAQIPMDDRQDMIMAHPDEMDSLIKGCALDMQRGYVADYQKHGVEMLEEAINSPDQETRQAAVAVLVKDGPVYLAKADVGMQNTFFRRLKSIGEMTTEQYDDLIDRIFADLKDAELKNALYHEVYKRKPRGEKLIRKLPNEKILSLLKDTKLDLLMRSDLAQIYLFERKKIDARVYATILQLLEGTGGDIGEAIVDAAFQSDDPSACLIALSESHHHIELKDAAMARLAEQEWEDPSQLIKTIATIGRHDLPGQCPWRYRIVAPHPKPNISRDRRLGIQAPEFPYALRSLPAKIDYRHDTPIPGRTTMYVTPDDPAGYWSILEVKIKPMHPDKLRIYDDETGKKPVRGFMRTPGRQQGRYQDKRSALTFSGSGELIIEGDMYVTQTSDKKDTKVIIPIKTTIHVDSRQPQNE